MSSSQVNFFATPLRAAVTVANLGTPDVCTVLTYAFPGTAMELSLWVCRVAGALSLFAHDHTLHRTWAYTMWHLSCFGVVMSRVVCRCACTSRRAPRMLLCA